MNKSDIVLFETKDSSIILPVRMTGDTVWLNRSQMAELFERDVKTIGKHISNALREEVDSSTVAKFATVQEEGNRSVTREIEYYNLDMIISVGYRVKSNRGVEFRKWANRVLRQYILQGYAVNERRINQLGEVVRLMKRTQDSLDSKQVLSVIERYSTALNMLDAYDHQSLQRPKGSDAAYKTECVLEMSQNYSGRKKMIPLKEVLEIYISLLAGRRYIRRWKRRQQIFSIL